MFYSFSRRPVFARLILALLAIGFFAGAHPVSAAAGRVTLTGHLPVAALRQANLVGPLASQTRIPLAITLTALIHDLYDPTSPLFGKYLTCDEFTQRFAPSQAEYESVINYARGLGLTV